MHEAYLAAIDAVIEKGPFKDNWQSLQIEIEESRENH